jgi:6-phosphogluconolactonase (cycloisomerase 2 family)
LFALGLLFFLGCGKVQIRDPGPLTTGNNLNGTGGGTGIAIGAFELVYAVANGAGLIQPFVLDTFSGTLSNSALPQASATSGNHFSARSDGKFAYVTEFGTNAFTGFLVALDGSLTPLSGAPWGLSAGGESSDIGSEGRDLYVAAQTGTLSAYTISASGAPVANGTYAIGANIAWVKLHPSGKFLYVGSPAAGKIYGFSRNTANGALSPLAGSPFGAPASTSQFVFDPNGAYVVVSGAGSGLQSYSINTGTGALTPVTNIPSAAGFTALAVDGSGNYVYAVDFPDREILGYSVNTSTGALVALGLSFPISLPNVNPNAIATDVTGQLVFVGNSDGSISGFAVIPGTGDLSLLAGYPLATGLASVDALGVAVPSY